MPASAATGSGHGPVLVTGATGRIGRRVVDRLLEAGVPVRALTRRPSKAQLPLAVEVVSGDLASPESLNAGLHGVRTAFLVWTLPIDSAAAVIERLATHTQRVVFLSSPHQTPHPFFQQPNPAATLHADIERLIAESGLAATMLRPGMFASNTVHWWSEPIKNGEVIRWPYGDAETAPIDERDIASVAARALVDDDHAGGDYVLTGPESLSQAEQVRLIGDAVGRRIPFQELSPDEFREETAETWPRPVVDMLLAAWAATMGRPAFVTSTVLDIVGSPPRAFAQWATDHAAAFSSCRL
ncbi:MAG: NmrA family NAD(P)-binding protein [Actinomycetes bacterium]